CSRMLQRTSWIPSVSRRLLANRADHLRRPSGLLDLIQRRLRKLVGLHRDLARQLAGAENLESFPQLLDDAQLHQAIGVEGIALEFFQTPQVDDSELLLEDVGESALGKPAVERH